MKVPPNPLLRAHPLLRRVADDPSGTRAEVDLEPHLKVPKPKPSNTEQSTDAPRSPSPTTAGIPPWQSWLPLRGWRILGRVYDHSIGWLDVALGSGPVGPVDAQREHGDDAPRSGYTGFGRRLYPRRVRIRPTTTRQVSPLHPPHTYAQHLHSTTCSPTPSL